MINTDYAYHLFAIGCIIASLMLFVPTMLIDAKTKYKNLNLTLYISTLLWFFVALCFQFNFLNSRHWFLDFDIYYILLFLDVFCILITLIKNHYCSTKMNIFYVLDLTLMIVLCVILFVQQNQGNHIHEIVH